MAMVNLEIVILILKNVSIQTRKIPISDHSGYENVTQFEVTET